jgi:prevent-host-death family protein
MSSNVTAFEAKTRLGRLLDRVNGGEEIIITRHGTPVARLVPAAHPEAGGVAGALKALRQIRRTAARQGGKVTRKDIRAWINEGRR